MTTIKYDTTPLTIQKLDRRMSGHTKFKYRLEFPWGVFRDTLNPWLSRAKAYHDFCRHMTGIFGFGPHVDDAEGYANCYNEDPKWGFRLNDHAHMYTIYMADEEAKSEVEKLLMFGILSKN